MILIKVNGLKIEINPFDIIRLKNKENNTTVFTRKTVNNKFEYDEFLVKENITQIKRMVCNFIQEKFNFND